MSVQEHYKQHLSQIYDWMVGDFDTAQGIQQSILQRNNIAPSVTKMAFDLGCGHGLQAISLAKLGFSVRAVDTDAYLLAGLNSRKANLPIETHHASMLDFLNHHQHEQADVIVCMGDTLPHLATTDQVQQVIHLAWQRLVNAGILMISFRDYSVALTGDQRFIPVRSDEHRILTCFLEYTTDRVLVHDLIQERTPQGWKQRISSYPKLRLSKSWMIQALEVQGFVTRHEEINRMHYLVAKKTH